MSIAVKLSGTSTPGEIAIGILDAREIWSAGIASLAIDCGFHIAGCWSGVQTAMPTLINNAPDILILSAALLGEANSNAFAELEQRPAIILVLEAGEPICREALAQFPFEGLVFRDTPVRAMQECLQSVAAGRAWLDAALFGSRDSGSPALDWSRLSVRELEIAHLAAHGLSNKRIAKTLHVSDGTVKMHMHHILGKLQVAHRADLNDALLSTDRNPAPADRETVAK